jgi:ribosome production factor 1
LARVGQCPRLGERLKTDDPHAITAQGEVVYSARLQELGPRFTLRMQSLQRGTFDSKSGEYEWVRENGKSVTRKKFVL